MILNEYYNVDIKTLKLPWYFNEELKHLPIDTQIMIFEEDYKKINIQNLISWSIIYQIQ
jgi:hypothetical protein